MRSPGLDELTKRKLNDAELKAEIDAAKEWRLYDTGVGLFEWDEFRQAVGRLSVREKLRPKHWQRELEDFFMCRIIVAGLPEDEKQARIIADVITELMNGSRAWCNPEIGVDDAAARAALRKAFDQILAAQDSTDTDCTLVGDVELPSPVDVAAKTAALAAEMDL